jgi:hypothetical protein
VCGDAALYFDPLQIDDIAAKLVQLQTDATLCDQLRKKGLERSRLFAWDTCSLKTAEGLRSNL